MVVAEGHFVAAVAPKHEHHKIHFQVCPLPLSGCTVASSSGVKGRNGATDIKRLGRAQTLRHQQAVHRHSALSRDKGASEDPKMPSACR